MNRDVFDRGAVPRPSALENAHASGGFPPDAKNSPPSTTVFTSDRADSIQICVVAWHRFRFCVVRRLEASTMAFRHILVPTDFSTHGDEAIRRAFELARQFRAAVHLLHVVEYPWAAGVWSPEVYTADIADLQLNLVRDAEQRLRGCVPENAETVTTEVRSGYAAGQILEVARERGCDLIVMGTHGRTGFAHVVMGSVAEKIVRLAPCPVLTLRAAEKPDTANVA